MPRNNSKTRRGLRQIEARERQEQRDRRSPEHQLRVLKARGPIDGGGAKKETARLSAQVQK